MILGLEGSRDEKSRLWVFNAAVQEREAWREARAWVFEAMEGEDTWADVPEGIRRASALEHAREIEIFVPKDHADLGRRGVEVRRRAETKLRSGPSFQNQHRSVAVRTQPGNGLL